jgi:uncharacterized membrane protein YgcG
MFRKCVAVLVLLFMLSVPLMPFTAAAAVAQHQYANEITTEEYVIIGFIFFMVGGSLITVGVVLLEVKKHRPVKLATDANKYVENATMNKTEDTFLRTHSTRVKVSSGKSSGGGSGGARTGGGSGGGMRTGGGAKSRGSSRGSGVAKIAGGIISASVKSSRRRK